MDSLGAVGWTQQFVRYALVGIIANALGYGTYIVLTLSGLGPKLAMTLVYGAGVLQTFVLNRAWTFEHQGPAATALVRYATVYALGYGLNWTALLLLVDHAGWPHQWVMAGLVLFMALAFFFGQKLWVFRSHPTAWLPSTESQEPTRPAQWKPATKRWLFGAYAYAENLIRLVLELLPHPLRYWIYKALLGRLGANSVIDYQCYFRYPWKVRVGDSVWINRGCEIYGSMLTGTAHISIGDHTALGPRVRILSATHNYGQLSLPDQAASVHIGTHVWIGAGTTILPGVRIGDGAVVGAGSVVTRNVAPYSIVAGNPARLLKQRELEHASTVQ